MVFSKIKSIRIAVNDIVDVIYKKITGKKLSFGLRVEEFGNYLVAFRVGTSDENVILDSFDNDIFFSEVSEYKPDKKHTIIDVGAHIGTFSLLASSKTKEGRVYSIEASRESFDLLRVNIALNKIENINPFHLALSDKEGDCKLFHGDCNWGHSTVANNSKDFEITKSITLQNFLEENQIAKCQFIKLNCEGAEFPIILSTSPKTLSCFEVILILYHSDLWPANSLDDLLNHLRKSGFSIRLSNQTKKRGWIIAKK